MVSLNIDDSQDLDRHLVIRWARRRQSKGCVDLFRTGQVVKQCRIFHLLQFAFRIAGLRSSPDSFSLSSFRLLA